MVCVEDFFDAINEVHSKEKGHIGTKKTATEVILSIELVMSKFRTLLSIMIFLFDIRIPCMIDD